MYNGIRKTVGISLNVNNAFQLSSILQNTLSERIYHLAALQHIQFRRVCQTSSLQTSPHHLATQYELPNPTTNTSSDVKPFSSIPGPKRVPILGTLLDYKLGIKKKDYYHEYLRDMYEKYGPIVREDFGSTTLIHIFDPADIAKVYWGLRVPHIAPLLETAQEYKEEKGSSQGIGNTNGEHWQLLRKAVNKFTLNPKFSERYIPLHDAAAIAAVELLDKRYVQSDGSVPLVEELLDRFVTQSIGQIVTGVTHDSLNPDTFSSDDFAVKMGKLNREIFDLSTHLKLSTGLYKRYQTPKSKKLWKLNDQFYGALHDVCSVEAFKKAANAMARVEGKEAPEDDTVMQHLIRNNMMSGKDMITVLSSLLTDSYITTVPSLLGALHLLALNPDVQEELYNEVQMACPPSEAITHQHLTAARKISAFLKESFRLYPIGDSVQRLLTENVVLSNYRLPRGTRLDLNQYIWLRDEAIFPEPEKVMLERWTRPPKAGVTSLYNPILNTPFSFGVRTCVGRRFATNDMSCFIARVLQRFKLTLTEPKKSRQVYRILLRPETPIPFTFQRRT